MTLGNVAEASTPDAGDDPELKRTLGQFQVFAMARDRRFTAHALMRRVNPKTQTPIFATILIVVIGVGLMIALPGQALLQLILGGMILPALIYGAIVILYLMVRKRLEQKEGGFSLGRFELSVAVAALIWVAAALVFLVTPGDATIPTLVLLGLILAGGVYFAYLITFHRDVLDIESGDIDASASSDERQGRGGQTGTCREPTPVNLADRSRPGNALALMIRPLLSAMLAASLVLTGCQGIEPTAEAAPYPTGPVTMTAGANPGSGFDLTIRAVVDALQKERIVNVPLPVQNRPGGSGADFLAAMVEQYRGAEDQVSVTSLSMMVNQRNGVSKYGYGDVTMIARLMTEYFVVVTRSGSAFTNLGDVMAAIRSDPARVAVGAAHDDEAPFDLLVSAAGGDPAAVHYVTHEGGGDQSAALLDGDIDVAIGGVSEFIGQLRSKEIAPLGVLAENRLPGLDVPTAREQGLDVTLANWRGLYGPPDMPQAAVDYWQQAVAKMVESPTWKQIAERSQFTTTFLLGDEFQDFLAKTQADVDAALEGAGR